MSRCRYANGRTGSRMGSIVRHQHTAAPSVVAPTGRLCDVDHAHFFGAPVTKGLARLLGRGKEGSRLMNRCRHVNACHGSRRAVALAPRCHGAVGVSKLRVGVHLAGFVRCGVPDPGTPTSVVWSNTDSVDSGSLLRLLGAVVVASGGVLGRCRFHGGNASQFGHRCAEEVSGAAAAPLWGSEPALTWAVTPCPVWLNAQCMPWMDRLSAQYIPIVVGIPRIRRALCLRSRHERRRPGGGEREWQGTRRDYKLVCHASAHERGPVPCGGLAATWAGTAASGWKAGRPEMPSGEIMGWEHRDGR